MCVICIQKPEPCNPFVVATSSSGVVDLISGLDAIWHKSYRGGDSALQNTQTCFLLSGPWLGV